MSEKLFEVVLTGNLIPGMDEEEVKENMATLFKTDRMRVEKLLATPYSVIKKGIDHQTAFKYHQALRKAGVLAMVRPIEQLEVVEVEQPESMDDESVEQIQEPLVESSPAAEESQIVDETPVQRIIEPEEQLLPEKEADMSLAETGEDIPNLKEEKELVTPDISSYSVANVGEDIPNLQQEKQEVNPDTSGLSVASAGEPLTESKRFEPREINTDALSLGQAGEELGELKKDQKPVKPDTSNLKLDESD